MGSSRCVLPEKSERESNEKVRNGGATCGSSEVSDDRYRRWILFAFSLVSTSTVAGAIYGWPALRRRLQQDGSTLSETQLGAIFTAATWSAQGGRVITGLARDRFGSRSVGCAALSAGALGAVGISLCDLSDPLQLGMSLFIFGLGAGIMLVMQPVGSLFPSYSNAIITTLSGSFQCAALVFLTLTSSSDLSRRQAFIAYAMFISVLVVVGWFLLPQTATFIIPARPQDVDMSDESGATIDDSEEESCKYYVGSLGFQLESMGDADGFYTELFSIVFAASAVMAPVGGYTSDRCGLGLTQGIAIVLVSLSLLILGLGDRIPLSAQASSLVFYGVGRMFISGMFFSNIGRRFGYTNFGTLSGLGLFVCATIGNLQYPMIAAASKGQASFVNYCSASILFLTMIPYCIWLHYEERRSPMAKSLLEPTSGESRLRQSFAVDEISSAALPEREAKPNERFVFVDLSQVITEIEV